MIDQKTEQSIAATLAEYYGLEGELSRLGGENLNVLVRTPDGQKFVFKVVDDDMPPEVVEMEFSVIDHAISGGFGPDLPRIIKNNLGNTETRINIPLSGLDRARLIAFIPGNDMDSLADISMDLFKSVGRTVAEFNLLMEDFDHPVAHRTHRWDLAAADQHSHSISLIEDDEKRDLLAWAYEQWLGKARTRFGDLPTQFIHGDANRANLMAVGNEVSGLIDFGDACFNPTICELAICLAYMMMDRDDPMEVAEAVIGAYHDVRPLSGLEREVLFPLVCGRLAVTISVANQRKLIDPNNPTWFGDEVKAWRLLHVLSRPGSQSLLGDL